MRETSQYARKSRMCVFSKRRYEEWKCILLKEKKVVLPQSWLLVPESTDVMFPGHRVPEPRLSQVPRAHYSTI